MDSTLPDLPRPTPVILTPPTGTRRIRTNSGHRKKRRSSIGRVRALIRAEPTAIHLLAAACLYWAVPAVLEALQTLPLPHDGIYAAVGYLMWSGSAGASERMQQAFEAGVTLHLIAASVLVASALLPREKFFTPIHVVARRFYRYAIALPLWTILTANLARFVADEVYVLTSFATWDFTPYVARVEGPVITFMQRWLESSGVSFVASNYYSAIWVGVLAFAGFALVAADKGRLLNSLIVAYALTAACAVPLFVLIPLFEPWTTNALYGAPDAATGVRYLFSHASGATLTRINTGFHSAAIGTLPSLHVAFPLVVSLVLRRHRERIASIALAIMAALSAFVVVYLGRNWIVATAAAVPFAFAVADLTRRVPLNVTIKLRRTAKPVLRPGEVAVPMDPAVDGAQWFSGVLVASGFAAALYALGWQRALAPSIGVGPMATGLVTSAFMVGIIAGVLAGGALTKRSVSTLPLWFAATQAGIAVFGALSPMVIHLLGRALSSAPTLVAGVVIFGLLVPATMLIGVTLPMLVTNEIRVRRSVGDGVGRGYFNVCLGAGAASAIAALVLFGPLGQSATVQVAAVLNLGAGLLAFAHSRAPKVIR